MSKQAILGKVLEWVFMFGLLYLLVWLTISTGVLDDLSLETRADKIAAIVGAIIMVHLVLAVHELGHLLVGMAVGFQFEMYVVGLLGIKRAEGKVQVYLNKNLGYYGGVAATSPIDDHPDNARKFAWILLAGPIASVLFAISCMVAMMFVGSLAKFILFVGGLASVGIFFATTIPSKTGMFFTDRKRYQRLVRPGKDREVEIAMLNIMGKFAKDNSYRNIDAGDIQLLIADDIPFINMFGLFNAVCQQLEMKGSVDPNIEAAWHDASQATSKSLATVFNKEIESYRAKFASAPPSE